MQQELFSLGSDPVTLDRLLTAIAIGALVLAAAGAVEFLVSRALRRRDVAPGTRALLCRSARYGTWLVAAVLVLELIGVDLAAAVSAGAVLFIGIGFALQKILESMVAGFLLLSEREIEPGDVLELDGELVKVIKIGLRTTVLRSLMEGNIIIPNSRLAQTPVRNRTYRDSAVRVRGEVGVKYGSDLRAVQESLCAAGESVSFRRPDSPVLVLLDGFGPSSIDFVVFVTIEDAWTAPLASSELALAIHDQLAEGGVVIAFPQLDVHLDAPAVEALRAAS